MIVSSAASTACMQMHGVGLEKKYKIQKFWKSIFLSSYSESASKNKQFKSEHDHIRIKTSYVHQFVWFLFYLSRAKFASSRRIGWFLPKIVKKITILTSCVYMGHKKITILIENEINNQQIYVFVFYLFKINILIAFWGQKWWNFMIVSSGAASPTHACKSTVWVKEKKIKFLKNWKSSSYSELASKNN